MKTASAPPASPSCRARSTCCSPRPRSTRAGRWSCRRHFPSRACRCPAPACTPASSTWRAREQWRSPSTVGVSPPFLRDVAVGQWRMETVGAAGPRLPGGRLRRQLGGKRAGRAAGAVGARGQGRVRPRDRDLRAHARGPGSAAPRCCCCCRRRCCCNGAWRRSARVASEIRGIEHGKQAEVVGRYPSRDHGADEQPQHLDQAGAAAPDALPRSVELPRPQPEDAARRAAHRAARAGRAAGGRDPAGRAHGRHRPAPARPGGGERLVALRALPAAGPGAAPDPRFAGQGVCRQGPRLQHRLPARSRLADRRGRRLRDARQRPRQRRQVGAPRGSR